MNLSIVIAPVVMVLVEVIKRLGILEKRWLPVVALAIGIAAGAVFAAVEPQKAAEHIVNGLLYGGAAAGIYDAGTSTIKPEE